MADENILLSRIAALEMEISSMAEQVRPFAVGLCDPLPWIGAAAASGQSSMDYSDFAFGFSISGAEVTVSAGEVHAKKQEPIRIASKKITITTDYQYIWVEHVLESAQAVIQGPGTERPVSDDIMYRVWLHQFRLIDGAASLYQIGHIGNIYIFANY